MPNKHNLTFFFGLLLALFIVGCSDDDFTHESDTLDIRLTNSHIQAARRYYTLRFDLNGLSSTDTVLDLSCDAPWLTLTCDTLHGDGILDVFSEANIDSQSRVAKIRVTSRGHVGRQALVEVVQDAIDFSSNGEEDHTISYDLGYGFSVFDEYRSQNSVKAKVINVEGVAALYSKDSTFSLIQENLRGVEDIEYLSSYSLAEMSYKMVESCASSAGCLGFRKTTTRYREISKHDIKEQCYGYGRMTKIVANRNMDVGALHYLINRSDIPKENVFTEPFKLIYDNITNEKDNAKREKYIEYLLDQFGTHIVVRASLGGYIDYCFTLDRQTTEDLEKCANEESKRVFGKKVSSSSSSSSSYSITSSKNSQYAFTIVGGSKETRMGLQREISGMGENGAFSSNTLQDWLQSINAEVLDSKDRRDMLGVVDFRFIPIWELFPDDIAHSIMKEVIERSNEIANQFNVEEIGLDLYSIDLKNSHILDFSDSPDATLVKVIYKDGVPVCEVCNEYVPKIRSDRRVTVAYPIKNGRTQLAQGIFVGDGEGNRPARLFFANGEVEVNPLYELGDHDILNKLYYVHGNLYAHDYSLPFNEHVTTACSDYFLQFYDPSGPKYPVVKIGEGYWTRCPMKESMAWGYRIDPNDKNLILHEKFINGILYADTYDEQEIHFFLNNGSIYDYKVNESLGKRDKWYLPSTLERNNLTKYLGNNHKALFARQQSGFEADFSGCIGWEDPFNPNIKYEDEDGDPVKKHVYQGEYCFINFRDIVNATKNEVKVTLLILGRDYTWQKQELSQTANFAYPVRLYRSAAYCYPNLGK